MHPVYTQFWWMQVIANWTHWCVHVWKSTGEHHLWILPRMPRYMSCFRGVAYNCPLNSTYHPSKGLSSFFSERMVKVQVVQPYNSTDMATAQKNFLFILSERFDFHLHDNKLIAVHAFFNTYIDIAFSWWDIAIVALWNGLLISEVLHFYVKMALSCLKHSNSVLYGFA